ncbi:MAG: DUF2461 domain-containing protein [Calditrichaeota bacterium]|nr:DUF2461 domain-containing protein [Calditrichota bacterium]
MVFRGFHKEIFDFLQGLYEHNDREWFESHKQTYETLVKPTAKALVVALAPFVKLMNEELEVRPRIHKTISRIHNDLRFRKDRPPFKRYVFITFPKEGRRWADGPLLYLAIERRGVWVGFWSGSHPRRVFQKYWQSRLQQFGHLFQDYLERNRIITHYYLLLGNEEGPESEQLLTADLDFWRKLTEFSVGRFYPREDDLLYGSKFLEAVVHHFWDLYPFYIFQESGQVETELQEYWEKKEMFRIVE